MAIVTIIVIIMVRNEKVYLNLISLFVGIKLHLFFIANLYSVSRSVHVACIHLTTFLVITCGFVTSAKHHC